jgi:hypothetical protein
MALLPVLRRFGTGQRSWSVGSLVMGPDDDDVVADMCKEVPASPKLLLPAARHALLALPPKMLWAKELTFLGMLGSGTHGVVCKVCDQTGCVVRLSLARFLCFCVFVDGMGWGRLFVFVVSRRE